MIRTAQIMGMPVTVEVVDEAVAEAAIQRTFDYFRQVDARYSTYKEDSEISRINHGLPETEWSDEMKQILELCEQTKQETDGFFDINARRSAGSVRVGKRLGGSSGSAAFA